MRRLAMIAVSVLAAGGLAPTATSAEAAHCNAVNAQLQLSEGLYYSPGKRNVSIASFTIGSCTGTGGIFFYATCNRGIGEIYINGVLTSIDLEGSTLVFGALYGTPGTLTFLPNFSGGESCLAGSGADVFLATGSLGS